MRLLFVFGEAGAERIDGQRRRRCDGEGVFCGDVKTLADGRDGRSYDALGEAFVVDIGDVVDAQAAGSIGGVGVFAAGLNIENIAGMIGYGGKLAMAADKFLEIVGIGDALEVAAVNRFGLIVFGDGDGFESAFAGGDVNVAAHEIHEIGALEQELGHPGVVVVGGGDVAVAALFGFFAAHGVRNESAVGLAGKTFGGDGLLRVVEPFAIGVLRTDQHGAGLERAGAMRWPVTVPSTPSM